VIGHPILKKQTRPDSDMTGRVVSIGARMDGAGADPSAKNQ